MELWYLQELRWNRKLWEFFWKSEENSSLFVFFFTGWLNSVSCTCNETSSSRWFYFRHWVHSASTQGMEILTPLNEKYWNHTNSLCTLIAPIIPIGHDQSFSQERQLFLLAFSASHFSCGVRCSDGNIFNASSSQVLINRNQGYPLSIHCLWNRKQISWSGTQRKCFLVFSWEH